MSSPVSFNSPRALLQGSSFLTVPSLYDWHAQNNPEHPLFIYRESEEKLRTITWKDAIRGIHRAANSVLTKIGLRNVGSSPAVIAILAPSDTTTYSCVVLGTMRTGNIVFPISPRNSPEAIAHLLLKTKASFLLIGDDAGLLEHAETALKKLNEQKGDSSDEHVTEMLSMPTFEEMFPRQVGDKAELDKPLPQVVAATEAPALILHSSGSTAFPKPIVWSHRGLLEWAQNPYYGVLELSSVRMSCHSSAVYHAMGIGQLLFASSTGLIMVTFKPSSPPIFATPDRVFDEMVKTKCEVGAFVPMFLEQWAQDPKKVEYLKTMTRVVYGGGPLAKEVGDSLVKQGVPVCSLYGSTEAAYLTPFIQETQGLDWDYLQVSKQINHVYEPREDGTFELIILQSGDHSIPRVYNHKVNGEDAYATSDLFVRHPTKPNLWKIYGRTDDQIMLSSGEKTNPGPLEKILEQDPHISHAVMFGRGKFYNGVLIDPSPEFAFDPTSKGGELLLEKFRHMIWPTVERMNEFAPQHSRLFKEMIIVSTPNKPFTHTAKRTVRRPAVIKEYDPEIEALYQRVENMANMGINGEAQSGSDSEGIVQEWNFDNTIAFVRKVIVNVLERSVKDEDDLFQHGCDSLQATWIRMQITGMLRRTKPDIARQLPSQFVFQAPSISALTRLILRYINPDSAQDESDFDRRVKALEAAVKKFTADIPSRPAATQGLQVHRKDAGDVILLTGTTGGLGCNMLAHLSMDPSVSRIYAFNRKAKGSDLKPQSRSNLEERQLKAVKSRGLESEYMSSKVVLLEGDLLKPFFGLSEDIYAELRDSVTHIMHNAWPVDFNLNLSSLEGAIAGVRKLVDFALSTPYTDMPRILLSSSVAVCRNPSVPGFPKEEPALNASMPAGSGYGESKWVSERILAIASERTGLKTTSVRIGQLSGDKTGYWNEREWFPSLVKSGIFTHCLPAVPEERFQVTWLPMYDAARILVQMRQSDEPILHLVNAHPVPWNTIVGAIAAEIKVPLVPFEEWIQKLKNTVTQSNVSEVELMDRNPALKLVGFYSSASFDDERNEPLGILRLDITKAKKVVPALNDVYLGLSETKKWISAWRASAYLP